MLKVLFVQNKGYSSSSFTRQINMLKDFFNEKFINAGFINEKINFDIDTTKSDIDVKHKFYSMTADNIKFYGTANVKNELRQVIKEGDYHIVVFLYKPNEKVDGMILPFTTFSGLYKDTEFISIVDRVDKHAIVHEFIHAIINILERLGWVTHAIDQMDATLVNGKSIPYHKNHDPLAPDGNYAITLRGISPYIKYLNQMKPKRNWILEAIEQLMAQIAVLQKKVPEKPKYRYWSETEAENMSHDLMLMLDDLRDKVGFPLIKTSGYRTPEYNKQIGGASNSEHIKMPAEAMDIACTESSKRFAIIKTALEIGFNRIGIGQTFIHLGISKTHPQNVIWHYYK